MHVSDLPAEYRTICIDQLEITQTDNRPDAIEFYASITRISSIKGHSNVRILDVNDI